MRISFDLDDTLICYQPGVPCEPGLRWFWRLLASDEPLRQGTRGLISRLRQSGWETWIYTTSHRNPTSVRWWLWCHGIRVRKVINQDVHDRHLRRTHNDYPPSKNPAAFGIDLHVDDSVGVRMGRGRARVQCCGNRAGKRSVGRGGLVSDSRDAEPAKPEFRSRLGEGLLGTAPPYQTGVLSEAWRPQSVLGVIPMDTLRCRLAGFVTVQEDQGTNPHSLSYANSHCSSAFCACSRLPAC